MDPARLLKAPQASLTLHERYLTQEAVFRLWEATQSYRDRMLLRTLYGTGLRLGELASLQWKSIQLSDSGLGHLTVLGKGRKIRTVIIAPWLLSDLLRFAQSQGKKLGEDEKPLFLSQKGHPLK